MMTKELTLTEAYARIDLLERRLDRLESEHIKVSNHAPNCCREHGGYGFKNDCVFCRGISKGLE